MLPARLRPASFCRRIISKKRRRAGHADVYFPQEASAAMISQQGPFTRSGQRRLERPKYHRRCGERAVDHGGSHRPQPDESSAGGSSTASPPTSGRPARATPTMAARPGRSPASSRTTSSAATRCWPPMTAGSFFYLSLLEILLTDLWRSLNGGRIWTNLGPAKGGDKQWFTIDTTNSPGHGFQYQCWSTAANPYPGLTIQSFHRRRS